MGSKGNLKFLSEDYTHIDLYLMNRMNNIYIMHVIHLIYMTSKSQKKNIALKIDTYQMLEKHLIKLMEKSLSSKITFDDAVRDLLENAGE